MNTGFLKNDSDIWKARIRTFEELGFGNLRTAFSDFSGLSIRKTLWYRFVQVTFADSYISPQSIRTSRRGVFGHLSLRLSELSARRILTKAIRRFGNHRFCNSDIRHWQIQKSQTSQFGQIREKTCQKKSGFFVINSDKSGSGEFFQWLRRLLLTLQFSITVAHTKPCLQI